MNPEETSQTIIILCGPTASGKTAVAVEAAQRLGAEIVSADSGQVYRGMDIGTAKPSREDRSRVPFHLIDILDPDQQFSAADFRSRSLEAIGAIQKRGKRALVVGGTGLYLKALEQGLFEGPSRDDAVRAELEERVRRDGIESLHRELQEVDPSAAAAIPPKNRQRIIRALEVYRLTGRPISEFWKEDQARRGSGGRAIPTFIKYGLDLSRDELNRRIEERVEGMIEEGLLAEARGLWERWGRAAPGLKLIGYKEIVAYLEGKTGLEEAVALVIKNTRQYAKRQRTWFRKDKEIRWVSDLTKIMGDLTKG
ncbi:MAG TPA: tRNA (adenosine(37)-N6)-dimethylallyltransferase MiaA [bacterium]|nr:tRNA (adenosine(37)-N6)-dimethylallyltransferase MiaA [bacterium]